MKKIAFGIRAGIALVVFVTSSTGFAVAAEVAPKAAPEFSKSIELVSAKPKYGPDAEPLSVGGHSEYFKRGAGPDFFRTIPFYTGQDASSACSLGALTTLLNAVQAMNLKKTVGAATKNFVMTEMRKGFLEDDYVTRVSGDPKLALLKASRLGVGVAEFRDVVERTLAKADLTAKRAVVTLVEFKPKDGPHRASERTRFFADLAKNEKSDDDFIVLNFTQGVLTGDPEGMIGHVAVVAAYDEKTQSVLVLDPDREYYGPYWSPAKRVFEAVVDGHADRKAPGYLVVKVK